MPKALAQLQLHLEPEEPIEVYELTGALTALGRQYNLYVGNQRYFERAADARLLVSSISPGSIDISFVPDLSLAAAFLTPVVSDMQIVSEFARHIKGLIENFYPKKEGAYAPLDAVDVTVRDCDDAISIVKPIAKHGGSQTFNTYQGPVLQNIINITASDAPHESPHFIGTRKSLNF